MINQQTLVYAIYVLVVAAIILAVEALYLYFSSKKHYHGAVNRRLKRIETSENIETALQSLLQERGLDRSGNFLYPLAFINRLFLQSGRTGNPIVYIIVFFFVGVSIGIITFFIMRSTALGIVIFLFIAFLLPILLLLRMRARRILRFATQLPDAIDVVVRSLKAGHPTPVALALVGRELADPIGTEFGIVSDEMAYGLEFITAMRNLLERVGLEDLRIIVISLSIQQSTGGNLAEVLGNLSTVIRERFRMKRKIRAISAEGRLSAILLSIFPFFIFAVINITSPFYYGEVWDDPIVVPILMAAILWMMLGDYIMYKMVNFKF